MPECVRRELREVWAISFENQTRLLKSCCGGFVLELCAGPIPNSIEPVDTILPSSEGQSLISEFIIIIIP